MQVLFLTRYTRVGASSRMRFMQYYPIFEREDIHVKQSAFFGNRYLRALYVGKVNLPAVFAAYIKRFCILMTVLGYDRVVIEKELFPHLPAWAEYLLKLAGISYIADYDDAVFHNYDRHPNAKFRKYMGSKIDRVMQYSGTVVAGNEYLATRARKAGARNVIIIPTAIDIEKYQLKITELTESRPHFVIGWIGTKTTFEKHLLPCRDWILEAQKRLGIHFHIVGITEDMGLGPNVHYLKWSEGEEARLIRNFDVGIMPLVDSEWEKGKCAYKLIQYMACGLPIIASPVGMNTEVCLPETTGLLASSAKEWLSAIEFLAAHPEIRTAYGLAGRKMVEEHYCIQVTAASWLKVIKGI